MDGESTKLTDDAVVLLEQQYGPLDRNLPTGGSFGELSWADVRLARRNATIIAAEPASLIRIDKQLYRKTLYEMQVRTVPSVVLSMCRHSSDLKTGQLMLMLPLLTSFCDVIHRCMLSTLLRAQLTCIDTRYTLTLSAS